MSEREEFVQQAVGLLGASKSLLISQLPERYLAGASPAPVDYSDDEVRAMGIEELKRLSDISRTNLIKLSVGALVEDLSIIGYRNPSDDIADEVWETWRRMRMPIKTSMGLRHSFVHGASYLALWPDDSDEWQSAVIPPTDAVAIYDDPVNDPRPVFFAFRRPGTMSQIVVWEDKQCSVLDAADPSGKVNEASGPTSRSLFADVEPVVRLISGLWVAGQASTRISYPWLVRAPVGIIGSDSGHFGHGDGLVPDGEVRPLMIAQDRVEQTVYDLLLAQSFAAVAIRGISGVELPKDDDEAQAKKAEMGTERFMLGGSPDQKAWSLPASDLRPLIEAGNAAVRMFAILANQPPNRFLGNLENVSADALLSAREGHESQLSHYRENDGREFEEHNRAMAKARNKKDPGYKGRFLWRPTELRTISEVADAASKLNALGMDVTPLLERNLQWSREEVDQAIETYQTARQSPSPDMAALAGAGQRQLAPVPQETPPGPTPGDLRPAA